MLFNYLYHNCRLRNQKTKSDWLLPARILPPTYISSLYSPTQYSTPLESRKRKQNLEKKIRKVEKIKFFEIACVSTRGAYRVYSSTPVIARSINTIERLHAGV
jgi:hypothetical protein